MARFFGFESVRRIPTEQQRRFVEFLTHSQNIGS